MTELVNGKIPANTECPYSARCVSKQDGTCGHNGVNHPVPYSCGYARAFKIFSEVKSRELTDDELAERLQNCDPGRSPTSARSFMIMAANRLTARATQ